MTLPADDCVSPKAAAEELGYTFLPCVLSYLHRAPSLIQLNKLTAGNRKLDGGLRNSDCVADSNGNGNRGSNEEYINMKNVLVADDVDALVVPVSKEKDKQIKIILIIFMLSFLYFSQLSVLLNWLSFFGLFFP